MYKIFILLYFLYNINQNAHDETILIFLDVIIFLKIECENLDSAPILFLLP